MKPRAFEQLAAAMAHEVRNPLNSMAIHVELLEGRLRKAEIDRESVLKSLKVLGHEIERIDHVLDEYLRHAGPKESSRCPVEPGSLVAEVMSQIAKLASSRGVTTEVKVEPGAGSWMLDAEALSDALGAVVSNAVEASPPGTRVEIEVRSDENEAVLVVRDQGEGIAEQDLPRLFQVGFSRRGRDGVGLAVAKQIVKGHGGSISAASSGPGAGACFTLRLPLISDAE